MIGMAMAMRIFFWITSHLPNVMYGRTTMDTSMPNTRPPTISQLSIKGRDPAHRGRVLSTLVPVQSTALQTVFTRKESQLFTPKLSIKRRHLIHTTTSLPFLNGNQFQKIHANVGSTRSHRCDCFSLAGFGNNASEHVRFLNHTRGSLQMHTQIERQKGYALRVSRVSLEIDLATCLQE